MSITSAHGDTHRRDIAPPRPPHCRPRPMSIPSVRLYIALTSFTRRAFTQRVLQPRVFIRDTFNSLQNIEITARSFSPLENRWCTANIFSPSTRARARACERGNGVPSDSDFG